ncbi:DUF4349 domain-containing protein, partial [Xanthomonas perforans]
MSRAMQRYATAMLLGWALCGCAKHHAEMAADGGAAAPAPPAAQGNALAYEHDVRIELPADQIGQRIAAIRTACQDAQFGDCALLAVEQEGGRDPSGRVSVRLAPEGIEPMVQLAGQHGDVAARSTRAEDLAQQIADTGLAQA